MQNTPASSSFLADSIMAPAAPSLRPLYFVPSEGLYRLRGQAQVAHNGDPGLDDVGDQFSLSLFPLDLYGVGPGLHQLGYGVHCGGQALAGG